MHKWTKAANAPQLSRSVDLDGHKITELARDYSANWMTAIAFLDDQLANITGMLKSRRMWETTLMALTTDNGGYTKALGPCSPFDPVRGQTCMSGEAGANNYPLKGGKYSLWEGGIRGNAFVSGGLLPAAVRGTRLHGLMHICDWYSTYSALAGVSPADPTGEAAGGARVI